MNNSRSVTSNQTEPHPDLLVNLIKHLNSDFERPIAEPSKYAFEEVREQLVQYQRPIILDSGCGVGRSSRQLANEYPDHWVIGVDQSSHRLKKGMSASQEHNLIFARANLVDFWRLALNEKWRLDKHFILYPNPWPKKKHLQRRWHGHPLFPTLINLKGTLELRTNWRMYAEEFFLALDYMNYPVSEVEEFKPGVFLTPFEEKYHKSGQSLFRLTADLS